MRIAEHLLEVVLIVVVAIVLSYPAIHYVMRWVASVAEIMFE